MLYMYMYGLPLMCKIMALYMICTVDSNDVNYSYCSVRVAGLIL